MYITQSKSCYDATLMSVLSNDRLFRELLAILPLKSSPANRRRWLDLTTFYAVGRNCGTEMGLHYAKDPIRWTNESTLLSFQSWECYPGLQSRQLAQIEELDDCGDGA